MDKPCEITLLIPYYHVADNEFKDCLESIFSQTCQSFKVFVCGQGDSPVPIWAHKYPIHTLYLSEPGLTNARKYLLEHSCGDYFWFIDADDTIDNAAVEILIRAIGDYPEADIFLFRMKSVPGAQSFLPFPAGLNSDIDQLRGSVLIDDSCNSLAIKVFRRKNEISFFEYTGFLSEDKFFTLAYIDSCNSFVCVDAILYFYRRNGVSSGTKKIRLSTIQNLAEGIVCMEKHFPNDNRRFPNYRIRAKEIFSQISLLIAHKILNSSNFVSIFSPALIETIQIIDCHKKNILFSPVEKILFHFLSTRNFSFYRLFSHLNQFRLRLKRNKS